MPVFGQDGMSGKQNNSTLNNNNKKNYKMNGTEQMIIAMYEK